MTNTLRFHVTADRAGELTLGQLIDVEEKQTARSMSDILWLFVVDDAQNYLPEPEARAALRSMTMKQMREVVPRLMEEMKESAAPKV